MEGETPADAASQQGPPPTVAWLLKGATGSTQGVLELVDGRLSFTPTGVYKGAGIGADRRTEDGDRVFDAQLSEVSDVNYPWYYFGGGVKFKVGEESYRLSFVKPGNTQVHEYEMPSDVITGRRAGKLWKPVLTGGAR